MRWKKVVSIGLSALALCLVAAAMALAQRPAVTVQIRIETTGQVSVQPWPLPNSQPLATVLAGVVQCRGTTKIDGDTFGEFRCSNALRRDGLSLATVFDLAPI